VVRALEEKRREKKARAERLQRAEREFSAAQAALAAAQTALKGAESAKNAAVSRSETALNAGDFRTADEARALTERYGDAERASARLNEWKNAYAAVSARLEELQREDLTDGTAERLALARETLSAREREAEEASKELALLRDRLRRNEEALVRKIGLERDYCAAKERTELFERLKKLLEGNKFMEYAAEEYLQNVALTASGRLLTLTDGRYFLRYDDGFAVGDNFNGGKTRGVHTLSGGETFLVSLSLALALSAEICARSLRSGEFFFLDEGFGTLDERLVDTVMDSLEKLRSENFSIGIISHVEELKHRIDRKLTVVKANEKHGSQIHAE
ncbi:MAG: SbcC/MukB-like Walker B domain-containing protein, partial [Candidatus Gallimonas sp.]